jgi:hypothetical protein
MANRSWLIQAFQRSESEAQSLPSWAKEINAAVDEFYSRRSGELEIVNHPVRHPLSDRESTSGAIT